MTDEQLDIVARSIREAFPDHPDLSVELHDNPHVVEVPLLTSLRSTVVRKRPIKAKCSHQFRAVHSSGHREENWISGVCWHCTQSNTAFSAASWFSMQASAGSTQLALDNRICYRTLPDDVIPWAAPGFNLYGVHIEFAGFVDWSHQKWLNHDDMLRRGAYKTAVACKRHGIPIKWLGVNDLKSGKRDGITDHWAVSQAFHLSSHTDPRPAFPRQLVLEYTRHYRRKL